jgi:acetylglutamate kinase
MADAAAQAPLTLLKIGGEVLDQPELLDAALRAFAALPGPKVLVHGGGKAGTRMAARLGVETELVDGRRITSPEMLEVAVMVYGGLMNKQVVAKLQALGVDAAGFTGADLDLVRAQRRPPGRIDYGLAGDVQAVRAGVLARLLREGVTPVLAPLTHDGQGQLLNTNADTIASEAACALAGAFAVRLVFSFEKAGVLLDVADPQSLIRRLDRAAFETLAAGGQIAGGMLPKLQNAFAALGRGVQAVYICRADAVAQLGSPAFEGTEIRNGAPPA